MVVTKIYKDNGFWRALTETGSGLVVMRTYTLIGDLWHDEDGEPVENYIKDILNNSLPLDA